MSQQEPITNEKLASIIENEMNNTIGGGGDNFTEDSELTQAWEQALNYYLGRERGDEVSGRSKVISMDVADMVEQTLAQIMVAFETDNLGDFEAYDVNDEAQAQIESAAVNYAVQCKNNGFMELQSSIKDGLLQRNGIIEIFVDEWEEVEEQNWDNVPGSQIDQIMQTPGVEVTNAEVVSEGVYDPDGMLIQEPMANITISVKKPRKELKIESAPPEEIKVNSDHNSIFLHDARFVSRTKYPTRSELVQRGYDANVVDELSASTVRTSMDARARSRDEKENEMDSEQRATDRIQVDYCYILLDFDGDGIAERRRVVVADKTILENEIFPIVPFAAGTPFLMPHRFWCLSLFDKLKQTQDTKTSFLRKTLDNAEGLINQRVIAVPGMVNMDDVLSSRPTGVVRAKRTDAVTPWPVQNMGDTGFKMLSYMDKVRKEAGGAQLDLGTQENIPVQGQTAHGMERWMSSQEQLVHLMVKNFANTLVKETYRIAHALMRMFMPEMVMYKRNGVSGQTSPAAWPERGRVSIKIQPSMAERQRMYTVLQDIQEKQMQLMQEGKTGVMTDLKKLHNSLYDQAKEANIPNPDRYWIDPSSQQAMMAAQANAQHAEQMQAAEQANQDKLLQTQVLITQIQEQSDQLKIQSDQIKNQMDYMLKSNEQLRKWSELELVHSVDIPGEGQGG